MEEYRVRDVSSKATKVKKRDRFPLILTLLLIALVIVSVVSGVLYLKSSLRKNTVPASTNVSSPTSGEEKSPLDTTPLGRIDTTTWKTQKDQTLGITFRYPPTWTVTPGRYFNNDKNNPWYIMLTDPTYTTPNCKKDCPSFGMTLMLKANPQKRTLQEVMRNDYDAYTARAQKKEEVLILDQTLGKETYKKVVGSTGSIFYFLYLEKNGRIYLFYPDGGVATPIRFDGTSPIEHNITLFEKMISTISFTQ